MRASFGKDKISQLRSNADNIGADVVGRPNVDDLGCPLSRLSGDQTIPGVGITFYRKHSDDARLGQVSTLASHRGFLVGISNQPGHKRRIFHHHGASSHDFDENAIYIRDFSEDYRADISGTFDFVLMEFAPTLLGRLLSDSGDQVGKAPVCDPGQLDPVLANLARAMLAASTAGQAPSQLFVDQMTTVIGTHIAERYGDHLMTEPTRIQGLSRAQEIRAKEVLRNSLDGKISIDEVAALCGLSRGHFTRAFRVTTGQSPYRWLIGQRLTLACDLMRDLNAPLAQIAIDCGFADQSHFTRAFSNWAGLSPGNWRRRLV